MTPSSRDRLSVDLRGLKAGLIAHAQAQGQTPSDLVRALVSQVLEHAAPTGPDQLAVGVGSAASTRVRLCLRMHRDQAVAVVAGARNAGMRPGDYVGDLARQVPVLRFGGGRREHLAALMTSTSELATLSRNIHQLTALLRQANVAQARPYWERLGSVADDVRQHLELASRVLADLQPRRGTSDVAAFTHP